MKSTGVRSSDELHYLDFSLGQQDRIPSNSCPVDHLNFDVLRWAIVTSFDDKVAIHSIPS